MDIIAFYKIPLILQNIPKIVEGYFNCSYIGLTTLKGGPAFVKKRFGCNVNKLTTLLYCPKSYLVGMFYENNLLSTDYIPQIPNILDYEH